MSDTKNGICRRKFIHSAGAAAAVGAFSAGCMNLYKIDKAMNAESEMDLTKKVPSRLMDMIRKQSGKGPAPLPPTGVYPDMPHARVGIVGVRDSIEKSVREAVESAGGLSEIEKGQRVVIKPNMMMPADGYDDFHRVTTHPEVLRAVIRMVKERKAHPIVGDRGAFSDYQAMNATGFARVCMEENATFFPWIMGEYVKFHPGKRHWSNGLHIPKILVEADHFINVPVLKDHEESANRFTCCLKSYVGVCHPEDRWQKGANALHQKNIGEKIAEIALCKKTAMNVVDATTVIVKGGPDGVNKKSIWTRPNLVLASKDPVACDSAALAVLKLYGAENKVDLPYVHESVWDQAQIYYAAQLGIGQAEPEKITIEDARVSRLDEIKDNWN